MTKVLAFWARWTRSEGQKVERVSDYISHADDMHDLPLVSTSTWTTPRPRPRIGESLPWIERIPDVLYRALCHQAPRRSCNLRFASQAALHGVTVAVASA